VESYLYRSVIRRVQGSSISLCKFAANIDCYVGVNIRVVISGYQKFQIAVIYGCNGLVDHLIRFVDRVLYCLASKNIKSLLTKARSF
jgi:hypothetical protein